MIRLRFHPMAVLLLAVCVSIVPVCARADSIQDAQRMLKQGQLQQALDHAEQALAAKPKDAQARFLKGLILNEMNRQNDAIAVFTQLTEDYPELPEPYNNLAVIYAQMRQYDKAKTALEMAIRTHPSYATAHENLGDIYARLASQAYDKALQLDSSNTTAQNKLAMIRDLMTTSGRSGAARTATVAAPASLANAATTARPAAAPAAAAAVSPPPNLAAPKTDKPAVAARAEVPTPKAAAPAVADKAVAEKPPEPPTQAAPPKPAPPRDEKDIEAAVRNWTGAWSRKDVRGYLDAYARDFQPPKGQARAAWEADRRQRIDKPGPIKIAVENLRVERDGADRAVVRFRQHYESGALRISSGKTLVLVRRQGRWLIQQERVGG